jgi:hypothetical protein
MVGDEHLLHIGGEEAMKPGDIVLVLGDHTSEAWAGCLGFVESVGADGVGVWFRQQGAPPSVFDTLPAQKLRVVGAMPGKAS